MNVEIIYEKKFQHIETELFFQDEFEFVAEQENDQQVENETKRLSYDEIMAEIFKDVTFTPLPERIKNCELFIEKAIELSEYYEMDVVIKRYDDSVSVHYFFDGGSIRNINQLLGMADEISLWKDVLGYNIELTLTYYTHAKMRRGRVITP